MRIIVRLFFTAIICLQLGRANGQVSTGYTFSQEDGTYVPLLATPGSTPAVIFPSNWDDLAYTGYTLPFAFYFNGISHPAGTTIGLDTDGWICFNPTTMTGTLAGGSWINAFNSGGAYLYGTANNNGFAPFNMDVHHREYPDITGNTTGGSAVVTGITITEFDSLRIGTRLIGDGIQDGTVIIAMNTGAGNFTMSAPATATHVNLAITPACSIFGMVRGTAPNREFVIQWTQVRKYSFPSNDDINFQMILTESGGIASNQKLKAVYGNIKTNSTANVGVQVGLRGNSNADFNSRKYTGAGWANTIASTTNKDSVIFKTLINPASGLTFIWTPACVVLAPTGIISGSANVCPNSTHTYSLAEVVGSVIYTWSYTGAGATFAATTTDPTNSITFGPTATSGVLSVIPSNACGSGSTRNFNISVPAASVANISYPGSQVYCISDGAKNVSLTGPSGGNYISTPSGLGLNASNGQITPASSTTGIYNVIYNYTSSGCPSSDTTVVTIKDQVYASALASPLSVCNGANAQLNSAANSDYDITPITHNTFSPSGSPVVLWSTFTDEAMTGVITLPFSFAFYEQVYTQIYISSNGYIQFGTNTPNSFTAQLMPDPSAANNVLALAWANLVVDPATNPGAYVRYFTNGTSPNRRFIIEYNNLRFAGGNGLQNVTGQIRLFENDNHVEIHATSINGNGVMLNKVLGMENRLGTVAHNPTGRNIGSWDITVPEAWSFTPSGVSYLWIPSSNLSSSNIANPVISGLLSNTTYTVQITDNSTGCVGTAAVPISVLNAQILSTGTGSRCGTGSVTLNGVASGGNSIAWYDAAAGGNIIGLGSSLNTPVIPTTTTFYAVAESNISGRVTVGNGALIGTGYEAVFDHTYGGLQSQFLIRSTELAAAGLRAGPIGGLSFRIPVIASQAYANFSISLLATPNTSMNGGLNSAAFTTVYSNALYTPVAGNNNFIFGAGFVWNGTSNLIVKICWSNNNNGGIGNYVVVDPTDFISCAYYVANNSNALTVCSATNATGLYSKRPQFIFTGQVVGCRSSGMAAVATINPQPEDLTIVPQSAIICGPAVQTLRVTGGKYVTGNKISIMQEKFETFPAPAFSASGPMITASSSLSYFSEGSRAVRLAYTGTPSAGLTSGNNSYGMTANLNLSTYARAELSFSHICALEKDDVTFDAGYVQYSPDAGATWITFPTASYSGPGGLITTVNGLPVSGTVFSTKSYTDWADLFTSNTSTPGLAGPSQTLWKTERISIPYTALTTQFRLRFVITNDPNIAYYGWLIDNIQITGYAATQAPVVWTPNGAGSGLFTNLAASIVYNGTNLLTVYARPTVTTNFEVTGTGPTGCNMKDTTAITVKPYNTWLGLTTDWNDPDNWCPGTPTATSDVVIPNGLPYYPLIFDSLPVARNIDIQNAASIEILGAARLSVYGNLLNSGTITNNGTLTMSGSIAQSYPGNAGTIAAMRILEIANTGAGVLLDKSTYVSEELKPSSGTFALGNFDFTIRSADTLTARVSRLGATSAFTYGTGRFIVERFIRQGRKWRFLSVPTNTTQSINAAWQEGALTAASDPVPGYGTHITSSTTPLPQYYDSYSPGGPSIKIWNPGTQNYISMPNTTMNIATDKGYMTFVRGNRLSVPSNSLLTSTRLRTRGQLFTGNKTISSTGLLSNQFMSAGNPYASAIDMRQISRTNVSAMYYIWDPMLANSVNGGIFGLGAYQLFTLNTGTGNYEVFPGGGSYGAANSVDNKIESGAAFFVKVSANGTGTLGFTENSKTDNSRSVFRTFNAQQRLMAILEKPDVSPGNYFIADGVMLHFSSAYSNKVDAEDANKLPNTGENIAILTSNTELMLERHAAVTNADTIFLRIRNMRVQNYRLKLSAENMLSARPILVDRYLNTYTPFSAQAYYGFTISNVPASYATDRFIIIFKQSTTLPVTFVNVDAQWNNKNIAISWKIQDELNIAGYTVERSADGLSFTSIAGNTVPENTGGNPAYQAEDIYPLGTTSYYRIKAVETGGRIFYSDVVRLEMKPDEPLITIAPNPVTDKKLQIRFINQPPGKYRLKVMASTGQEILSTIINLGPGLDLHKINLPVAATAGVYMVSITSPEKNTVIKNIIVE